MLFDSASKSNVLQFIHIPSAHPHHGIVIHDYVVAFPITMHLPDPLQVDDRRAMYANEEPGI